MKNIVRHILQAKQINDLCGQIFPITSAEDFPEVNVVYLKAERPPSKSHFHQKSTEIYLIESGSGLVRLDDETIQVNAGNVIMIRPNTIHKLVPDELEIIGAWVISSPAWSPDDQFEVDD